MKRILGKIKKDIAIENGIPEYANKSIVLYDNDRKHCEKRHMHEFASKQAFHYVMDNLEVIICEPDKVYYVKTKDTLEYYKFFEDLGITVRVKLENGKKEAKVKTMFIVKPKKLENKEQNKYYNMYVVGVK